jgi:putative restriction endonuclease
MAESPKYSLPPGDDEAAAVLARLASLRQHQRDGHRSPHKPLLVLLALGRLLATGSSALPWPAAETELAGLLAEFGPPSRTGRAQSAAYPFTRLRADKVWVLDQDVQMDLVRPLAAGQVTGRLEPSVEDALLARPSLIRAAARDLVMSNFPGTVAPDVLEAVGLDPGEVLGASDLPVLPGAGTASGPGGRRRDPGWRAGVLEAWDRQCAFCGYDGQIGGASAGIEAAHVQWFAFDGPDTPDNGLALCSLHHKLFDLGVLGLDQRLRIQVSTRFSARTQAGRAVYDMHGRVLSPRPGTVVPVAAHVSWHARQVFKGEPLAA